MRVHLAGTVLLASFAAALAVAALEADEGSAGQVRTCGRYVATVHGTAGNDRIVGTRRADVIVGLGGNDVIRSRGGGDVICGGPGADFIRSGGGNDEIYGDAANDILLGGAGKDKIYGKRGDDLLDGGPGGPDLCSGGAGRDIARADRCERIRSATGTTP